MSEESAEPAVEQVQEVEVSEGGQQEEVAEKNVQVKQEQLVVEEQDEPLDIEVAVESKEQQVPLELAQDVPPQEETMEVDQHEPDKKEEVAKIETKVEEQPAQVVEMVVEQSEVPENLQFVIQTEVPEVETDENVEIENEVPEIEPNIQEDNLETEIQVDEPQHQAEENKEVEESDRSPSSEESEDADDKEDKEEQERALEESQDAMQLPAAATFETALEDEEMPSMVTISSVSRIDESETNIKQDEEKKVDVEGSSSPERKPAPSKPAQDDSDSECVLIESDDDDNVDHRVNRRPADDDDDDEDDDDDSRDYSDDYDEGSSSGEFDSEAEMERERYESRYSRHPHRRHRDEKDDDDEEEEEYPEDDEDEERDRHRYPHEEDEDNDSEPDRFDATSDDLVLRHSNGLVKEHKERSASFTDLSLIRNSPLKQKHSVNPYSQRVREERNHQDGRKPRYGHVESKVKKYIMGIKEQSRMSTERKKSQEEAKYKNQEGTEVYRSEEVVNSCRAMKDYAEKELKEVAEYSEKEELYFQKGFENGEISIFPKNADATGEMEVDPIAVEPQKEQERMDKMNGAMQIDEPYVPERKGILRREDASSKRVLNGDGSSICNLRTLSYDEYMKPRSKDSSEDASSDQASSKQYNDNNEPMQIIRIESVMSNYLNSEKIDDSYYNRKTPPLENQSENQEQQGYYTENAEMDYLRQELEQKHAQFEHLKDAYQKAMAEKMAMQMEMQNMKQALSYYQHQEQQKKLLQKKETAIQTEPAIVTPRDMPILDIDGVDARLLGAESLASSQWSESTGSAAISMDPPNVTTALNSDESAGQQSKVSKKNAFSRAFVTSQRILQSLANITHGKKKTYSEKTPNPPKSTAKPLNRSALSSKSEDAQPNDRSASKKRKATDTLEMSSTAQPFKIPHTDGQQQKPGDADNQKSAENKESGEGKDEALEEDDVKLYIYPEDEDAQEHSFLIQAKADDPRPGVRECGPYLLGNVEVYMTEMNGTINIWGKELSQGSTSQNIEELEASVRSKDLKSGFRWQSTPRIFSHQGSSSTSKKSRVQPRFTQPQKSAAHHHHHHSCDLSNVAPVDCETCSPCHHRVAWPQSCSNHSIHENQHSCCTPTIRIDDSHCGCHSNTAKTCCNAQKFADPRRFSMPNVNQGAGCCNSGGGSNIQHQHHHCSPRSLQPEEMMHKPQAFVRRHSFNNQSDDEEQENENNEDYQVQHGDDEENGGENSTLKLNHSIQRDSSPHSCSSNNKLVPPQPGSRKRRRSSGGQSDSSTANQNESDPLLSQKNAADAPDPNKRKLGKRRVGGLLLDLLKGCGDCKSPMNKSSLQNNASIYEPSTSLHTKMACSQNQPSCSVRSTDKCSQCRVKRDKTDEIEAQLEFFSQEMNKLRSRSDTLRNMLDNLRDTAEC